MYKILPLHAHHISSLILPEDERAFLEVDLSESDEDSYDQILAAADAGRFSPNRAERVQREKGVGCGKENPVSGAGHAIEKPKMDFFVWG